VIGLVCRELVILPVAHFLFFEREMRPIRTLISLRNSATSCGAPGW
jgi:hypothetical protein